MGRASAFHINLIGGEWTCMYCNTIHDRDLNASRNLEQQITRGAGGQSDSYNNERGASVSLARARDLRLPQIPVSPAVPAVCAEPLTIPIQEDTVFEETSKT